MLGQSRVFYSMSVDGLLPKFLIDLHAPQIEHLIKRIMREVFVEYICGLCSDVRP
jgi:hypothetical protein